MCQTSSHIPRAYSLLHLLLRCSNMLSSSVVDTIFFYLQIRHLNEYHARCREIIGPLLKKMGHSEALEWLYRETEPFG